RIAGAVGQLLSASDAVKVHVPTGQQPVGTVAGRAGVPATNVPVILNVASQTIPSASLRSSDSGGNSSPTPHAPTERPRRIRAPSLRMPGVTQHRCHCEGVVFMSTGDSH